MCIHRDPHNHSAELYQLCSTSVADHLHAAVTRVESFLPDSFNHIVSALRGILLEGCIVLDYSADLRTTTPATSTTAPLAMTLIQQWNTQFLKSELIDSLHLHLHGRRMPGAQPEHATGHGCTRGDGSSPAAPCRCERWCRLESGLQVRKLFFAVSTGAGTTFFFLSTTCTSSSYSIFSSTATASISTVLSPAAPLADPEDVGDATGDNDNDLSDLDGDWSEGEAGDWGEI